MSAVVSERQLRSAISKILSEVRLIREADEVPDFPIEQYQIVKNGIKSTGASSGAAAVALAALFLSQGNDRGFIDYLIMSNPSFYPYFYQGMFQPVAGAPLDGETETTVTAVPDPDYNTIFTNLASALGYMGKSNLEPVLRRAIDEMKSAYDENTVYTLTNFSVKEARSVKQFLDAQPKNQEGGKGQSPTGVTKAADSPEFLGKRFSYEIEGTPELTVIAKLKGSDRDFIAKVYEPTTTVLDPIADKKGVLLSFEVFKNIKADLYDWEARFVDIEQAIQDEISRSANVGSTGTFGANIVGKKLYERYKIFVPTVPIYPPVFESTEAAYQKSLAYGCTLSSKDLVKQLAAVWDYGENSDRLIPCVKDYTADSFIYGIVNTIVGFLGPIGAVAGVAMDLVPGVLLTCYFFKKGQKELGITYLIYTIVSLMLPSVIASAASKTTKLAKSAAPDPDSLAVLKSETASGFLIGLGLAVPLAVVINKISSLFGDGTVYSNDQVVEFINSSVGDKTPEEIFKDAQQKTSELTLNGVLDPQGLRAKYPSVY